MLVIYPPDLHIAFRLDAGRFIHFGDVVLPLFLPSSVSVLLKCFNIPHTITSLCTPVLLGFSVAFLKRVYTPSS